jgi:hypothetical protein
MRILDADDVGFCALLALTSDYSILVLGSGRPWRDPLFFNLEELFGPSMQGDRQPEQRIILKLIVANQEFDASLLAQPPFGQQQATP